MSKTQSKTKVYLDPDNLELGQDRVTGDRREGAEGSRGEGGQCRDPGGMVMEALGVFKVKREAKGKEHEYQPR